MSGVYALPYSSIIEIQSGKILGRTASGVGIAQELSGADVASILALGSAAYADVEDISSLWGGITGTLSNQTDLNEALNARLSLTGGTMTGQLNGTSISLSGSLTVASSAGITSSNWTRVTGSNQPTRGIAVRDSQINFASNVSLYWSTSLDPTQNVGGVSLVTDGASYFWQRGGTTAQAFYLSNTYTDASNYENLQFSWVSNEARIGTRSAGTGTLRYLALGHWDAAGTWTKRIDIDNSWVTLSAGDGSGIFSARGGDYDALLLNSSRLGFETSTSGVGDIYIGRYAANTLGIYATRTGAGSALASLIAANATLSSGTITTSSPLNITQTWNNAETAFSAFEVAITNTASATSSAFIKALCDGEPYFEVRRDKSLWLGNDPYYTIGIGQATYPFLTGGFGINRTVTYGRIGFQDPTDTSDGPVIIGTKESKGLYLYHYDNSGKALRLFVDAANALAQRNGTNAQTFRLYNTYTDASNSENLQFSWVSNEARIGTAAAGTGTQRSLLLGHWDTAGNWQQRLAVVPSGNLITYATNFEFRVLAGGQVGIVNTANNLLTIAASSNGYPLVLRGNNHGVRLGDGTYTFDIKPVGSNSVVGFYTGQGTNPASGALASLVAANATLDTVTLTGAISGTNATFSDFIDASSIRCDGSVVFDTSGFFLDVGGSGGFSSIRLASNQGGDLRVLLGGNASSSTSPMMKILAGETTVRFRVANDSADADVTAKSLELSGRFDVYNSYTDASNYERGFIRWNENVLEIGTEAAGTGIARNMAFLAYNVTGINAQFSQSLRARDFIGNSTGYIYFQHRGLINSSANGVMHIQNYDANESVDQVLCLGPATSASNGVRLKRSVGTTVVAFRNGNDTADAGLQAATVTASSHFAATERSSDPSDPAEGNFALWMSDGTGSGDDGDIMVKITAGGVTTTTRLTGVTGRFDSTEYEFTGTYVYYGGEYENGDWEIRRVAVSGGAKTVANEGNNVGYTDLATAWTDRASLTYA